jgi:hypothetical protein
VSAADEVTPKTPLEIIEERRAARKAATADAKSVQHLADMTALDALEEKHGEGQLKTLHVPTFVPGLPTLVVVKSPAGTSYWKRFVDKVQDAKGHEKMKQAAGEQLARACIVYPTDAGVLGSMVESFPNTLVDAANAAAGFVQLTAEAEKKD